MPNILITTSSFDTSHPLLVQLTDDGFEIHTNPVGRKLEESEISQLIERLDPVGMIAGVEPITEQVIAKAKSLKTISRCGAGLDSVDLNAAKKTGISVHNTPAAPAQTVAELTVGLILSALRKVPQSHNSILRGNWRVEKGNLLSEKTVGLVGAGHIGEIVAALCLAFGAHVIVSDPARTSPPSGCTLVPFESLLSQSDIVSLHLSYSEKVRHLIGKDEFGAMKRSATLINCARGGLVDEGALFDALISGAISAAAVDVFEQEPYQGALCQLENVILTPHIGSFAAETRVTMESEAVRISWWAFAKLA